MMSFPLISRAICLPSFPSHLSSSSPSSSSSSITSIQSLNKTQRTQFAITFPSLFSLSKLVSINNSKSSQTQVKLATWQPPKYVYPDPIPEFAIAESEKFERELRKKLLKSKESFGDDIDAVVKVCAEIFSEFMHREYGGPGTLLVEPFTDMLLALKEKKLPGATTAARAALLWAQHYVDQDWEIWNSQLPKINTPGPTSQSRG